MTGYDADVAVVGLGAWGSAALWRLTERGIGAIGFEAQRLAHPYGSSHGHTRLFRVACHEHVGLTPIARKSRELWRELESLSGTELLHETGVLSVGPADGRAIGTTAVAAERAGIEVVPLSVDELRERYPQHAGLPDHYVGLLDRESGVVRVEETILAQIARARALGAIVHEGTRVSRVAEDGSGVLISTSGRSFRVRQVVLAAGPWMSTMQDLVPLTAYRAPMLWWRTVAEEDAPDFAIERFPAFIRHYDDVHTIWGHGSTTTTPVKVGLSEDPRSKLATDPDLLDRGIDPARDWGATVEVLRRALPRLHPEPVSASPCMITESPDRQFLVGRDPRAGRIVLAGGCSGHGFKHASGIGEVLARIVGDEEPFADAGFMDPARFAR